MASSDSWTTIESDPGVFTELISRMGVKGVEVAELWSCDRESLQALPQPIYGLIFLFKWQKEEDSRLVDAEYAQRGIFFSAQVITNACATQAIVSVLLNAAGRPGLELGPELTALKDFTASFTPDMTGLAIGNSDTIRSVHNSFHPPQPLLPEDKEDDKEGDAFHFVAYMPVAGALYELDGLKHGPVRIAECPEDDWLEAAAAAVNERITRYSAAEQRFNLMAVVRSRREVLQEQLHSLQAERAALQSGSGGGGAQDPAARLAEIEQEESGATAMLAEEEEKHQRWADENLRRRTDFIPFAFNLLKGLASAEKLQPLVQQAEAGSK